MKRKLLFALLLAAGFIIIASVGLLIQYPRARSLYWTGGDYYSQATRTKITEAPRPVYLLPEEERYILLMKAIEKFNAAKKAFPFNYKFYRDLGNAYMEMGKYEKVKQMYRKAKLLGWKVFDEEYYTLKMTTLNSKVGDEEKKKYFSLERAEFIIRSKTEVYDLLEGAIIFLEYNRFEKAEDCVKRAEEFLNQQEDKIAIENVRKRIQIKKNNLAQDHNE